MTESDMPEPLRTIARRRGENATDLVIAAELGMTADSLWRRVSRWNAKHPDKRVLNRRASQNRVANTAKLTAAGASVPEVAAVLGCSVAHTYALRRKARRGGLLEQPEMRYSTLRSKGAAPPMGSISGVWDALTPFARAALIARTTAADTTLAQTIARLLTEVLDGGQK